MQVFSRFSLRGQSVKQVLRYGIVGVAHNLSGYILYLLLTFLGVPPVVAVAFLYPLGSAVSFYFNRRWSFSHSGKLGSSVARYILAQICGYVTNLLVVYLGVNVLGWPHQIVQIGAMVIIAGELFLLMKFFVFKK